MSKGAFNNYLDLPISNPPAPPPLPAWIVFIPYGWTKNKLFVPLPPHLVQVVIEWPLRPWHYL